MRWSDVEAYFAGFPETVVAASYGGFPAVKVNRKLVCRMRGEMADHPDPAFDRPYGEVLMVGVADLGLKEALLGEDDRVFFTVPHYDGYPAVLVRLSEVTEPDRVAEVEELLDDAWRAAAPKRAIRAREA